MRILSLSRLPKEKTDPFVFSLLSYPSHVYLFKYSNSKQVKKAFKVKACKYRNESQYPPKLRGESSI